MWYLISLIVESGWACKSVLEKVNGFLAFAFLFRRELFCLQHRIYTYVSKMPDAKWVRLPSFVVDELHSLGLHLVFAEWDMRCKLSSSILATDATPSSGGAVRAEAPDALVQELWRRSEVKGAPARLDRNSATEEPPEPTETSTFASACAESLPWCETAKYSFREREQSHQLARGAGPAARDPNSGQQIQPRPVHSDLLQRLTCLCVCFLQGPFVVVEAQRHPEGAATLPHHESDQLGSPMG